MSNSRRTGVMDRLLRLFTDVKAGESGTVLLLALNVFLILAAYSLIKPIREALILGRVGGAEIKAYTSAGVALLLLGIVPIYGVLAGRLPRRRLINVVTLFFATCMLGFYLIGQIAGSSLVLALAFFLWISIFSVMVIAQIWSFANDLYTSEEGERLFPIVAFGGSFGAVVGAWFSGGLISAFGVLMPLLVAAGILLLSLLVTNLVDARERRRKEAGMPDVLTTATQPAATSQISIADIRQAIEEYEAAEAEREAREEEKEELDAGPAPDLTQTWQFAGKGEGPFKLVFKCRYLLFIALLIMLLNWVNTNGEYILSSVVTDTARDVVATGAAGDLDEWIGTFYSRFHAVVNGLGLLIQLFLVSRIIKYFGARVSLLVLPVIALSGYLLLAFYPLLSIVRWTKTAENATDYSLQNTVRQMIFLPCTREQKYKAKQAIDSFFWRAGDMLAAGVVFVGTTFLAMGTSQFAMVNVALVLVWIVLAVLIGREYKQLVASGRPPCVENPFGAFSR